MTWITVILVAAATFGVCYLFDKGFTKIFRGRPQHATGRSVRMGKSQATVGTVLAVMGIAAFMAGLPEGGFLLWGGIGIFILGIALVVYYLTFGIYYDEETFLLTTFGKRSVTYRFGDIVSQQLFNSYGSIIIELYLKDGRSVQLQSRMEGVYPFLDAAYLGWQRQTGRAEADCPFHDPANSCWFPPAEV